MFNVFSVLLFFITASTQFCEASCEETGIVKLYVSAENLLINDNALLLIDGDEVIQVKSITVDDVGMYVIIAKDTIKARACLNGHPEYHSCGGCANWWCYYRCKCYSPWAGTNQD